MLYIAVDGGSMLSELAVLKENYASLCITMTDIIDPLVKYFVDGKYFTVEEENQIAATPEKLELLLNKISSLLKAGNSRGFYMMLQIMKEQGGKRTQNLADLITNILKISADELSHICKDDLHGHNEEVKGL